jgi:hypothetical protein
LAADIATAISDPTKIATAANVAVSVTTITGATTQNVTDLNTIDSNTTGVITGTIDGAVAVLVNLTHNSNNNTYAITVNDAASLAQLVSIDAATQGTLTYTAGGITDSATNLSSGNDGTLTTDADLYVADGIKVFVTGSPSDGLLIKLDTDNGAATVTAASLSGTASALAASIYVGTGTAVTVNDTGAVSIANLATIVGKIGNVNLLTLNGSVTGVTGAEADYYTSGSTLIAGVGTVLNAKNPAVAVTDATTALTLKLINAATTNLVDATAATTLSGNVTDVLAVLNALGTSSDAINLGNINTGVTDVAVTVSGAVSAANANTIANATSGAVTATVTAAAASVLAGALTNADANDALTLTVDVEASSAPTAQERSHRSSL